MRIFISAFLFLFFSTTSHSSGIAPAKKAMATDVMVPLFGSDKIISLYDLAHLNAAKYRELTGQKLSFLMRMQLKMSRRYAKKLIEKDGTVNPDKMKKKAGFFGEWSWHWGGFALGFLLILGPIICLFFNDDYKWDRFWTAMKVNIFIIAILGILLAAGV